MKIKMRTLAAGSGGNYLPGEVYSAPGDLSLDQAKAFVDGGYAELVGDVNKPVENKPEPAVEEIETASAKVEHEKAVKPEKVKK